MKLVRFLRASYINDRLCEAGSEHWIDDNVPLHEHHYDVHMDAHGEGPLPGDAKTPGPQFIDHSGDGVVDSLHSAGYNPSLAEQREYKPLLAEHTKDGAG